MIERSACPVCDGGNFTKKYEGKPIRQEWRDQRTFSVFTCEDCTHEFINPMPDETTLSEYYSSQYVAYKVEHGAGDLACARDKAARDQRFRHVELRKDMDVLDVGCGSGSFLSVIQDLVGSTQGIEPSEHGVATCHQLEVPVFSWKF